MSVDVLLKTLAVMLVVFTAIIDPAASVALALVLLVALCVLDVCRKARHHA
jgi:hypothetical protein